MTQPHDLNEAILFAIGSREGKTFDEFCDGLRCFNRLPFHKEGWKALIRAVVALETDRKVVATRAAGKIQTLALTDLGAALVANRLDEGRELFTATGLV